MGAAEFKDLRERGERTGKVPVSRVTDAERRRLAKEKDKDADRALRAALQTALMGDSSSAEKSSSEKGGLRSRRRGESAQELPPVKAVEEFNSAAQSPGGRHRSLAQTPQPERRPSDESVSRSMDRPERRSLDQPHRRASDQLSRKSSSESQEGGAHDIGSDEDPALEVPLSSLGSLETGEIRQIGIVERWQRGNLIGSGSYGKVYLGMNLDSGELFVVKQVVFANGVVAQGCPNQEDVGQLEQEIALLSTLAHDNIVKYLGTERNNLTNELSIFLEHMPGGSVADLVMRFGGLDESVIRKYTREVLEGLLYLHKKGIIHRDIKGQNILVDNRGVCKLADFGASRYLNKTADNNASFSFKGTPVFMSPEVITEQRYSRKSDVWSVGCTVLQMATGNPPYSEFSNHIAALFHITTTSEPPPIPEKMSSEGGAFILRCFTRDTSDRATVDELLRLPFVNPARASPKAQGYSPITTGSGQAQVPALVESPKQITPVSSTEGKLPDQDDDRAWERWKERQWKEGTKTAVRLKRVQGSATVQPALQRRGGSHQGVSRDMTVALDQMSEFPKKPRPQSFSGAEALTRALQIPPAAGGMYTSESVELGDLAKDTAPFPVLSPVGDEATDARNLTGSVHSSPDTSWGLQGKGLPPDPTTAEEGKEKGKEAERGLHV
uniref:Protein kinase domain-containing protein n=1 Tax=Hemiselmis andersenii TaxID=464988 RepID=A0A6U4JPI5_HEMAN